MNEIPRRQSYDLDRVEQWDPPMRPPVMPEPGDAATRWAEVLATDATIYGLGAVLQYGEMYVQAVDAAHPRYTGFFIFDHQRAPADPSFEAFRVPTVDNLYSNAFLDLAGGPALVRIPPMGERYYTLNLLDAYGNAYNLSARTVGANGGDYLIAPPRWWDAPRSEETAHATMFEPSTCRRCGSSCGCRSPTASATGPPCTPTAGSGDDPSVSAPDSRRRVPSR
ncbi:MAG: DUF1254 domain-containing protein [Ilumatobacteraceae bacterium]